MLETDPSMACLASGITFTLLNGTVKRGTTYAGMAGDKVGISWISYPEFGPACDGIGTKYD